MQGKGENHVGSAQREKLHAFAGGEKGAKKNGRGGETTIERARKARGKAW